MPVELAQPKVAVAQIEEQRTMRDAEILADTAKRIMREDVYILAKDNLRAHYLDLLAKADPTDQTVIMEYQATIRAIDGLNLELEKFSHAAAQQRPRAI